MAESFVEGGREKSSLSLCQTCHSRRSWLRISERSWEEGVAEPGLFEEEVYGGRVRFYQ